jgi:hypothetical protein
MIRIRRSLFILPTTVLFALGAFPQVGSSSRAAESPQHQSSLKPRTLFVTVDPASSEIQPADLEIREGGNSVAITSVRKVPRIPLHYCVLFDMSRSQDVGFQFQTDSALALLTRVIKPNVDHGWAVLFNDDLQESEETSDPHLIVSIISHAAASGGTRLDDAMASCANRMAKGKGEKIPELRVMFLFTNGQDDASFTTFQQALNTTLNAGIRVYAFAPEHGLEHYAKHVLAMSTKLTGGRLFQPTNLEGLDRAIDRTSQDFDGLVEAIFIPTGVEVDTLDVKARKAKTSSLAPQETAPEISK